MLLQRLKDFFKSLKTRGLIQTLLLLYSTLEEIFVKEDISEKTKGNVDTKQAGAQLYIPTKYKAITCFLKEYKVGTNDILIDVGAGKGRVMALAYNAGFKKVKGVEISKELFDQAMIVLTDNKVNFSLYQMDVLDYEIQNEDNVFYLYDPFSNDVLTEFLKRICNTGQFVKIIYHNNIDDKKELFSSFSEIKLVETKLYSGNRFFVYEKGMS